MTCPRYPHCPLINVVSISMTSSYMFNISIAGFNTGGGNVNFKGFANHVSLPFSSYKIDTSKVL